MPGRVRPMAAVWVVEDVDIEPQQVYLVEAAVSVPERACIGARQEKAVKVVQGSRRDGKVRNPG